MVWTLEIVMATTPMSEAFDPPAAPPVADVVVPSLPVAVRASAPAPVSPAFCTRRAATIESIMPRAMEAPMPVAPPFCAEVALAEFTCFPVALSVTAGVPASVLPTPRTSASVLPLTTVRAKEPAAPTPPELFVAPEVALEVKTEPPARVSSDSIVTDVAWIVEPEMYASVVTFATPMPTPTPTPAEPLDVVLPSPVALEEACELVRILRAPVTRCAAWTTACVTAVRTLTARAPARPIAPSAVVAWPFARDGSFTGLSLAVDPPWPAFADAAFAPSAFAAIVMFAAVVGTAPVESMTAFVVWLRFTIAMPAPEVAALASPVPVRPAWFVAVRARSPVTSRCAVFVTFVTAVELTVTIATEASFEAVPLESADPSLFAASEPGVAATSTVDVELTVVLPVAVTTAESPIVTSAPEVTTAASPYFLTSVTGPTVEAAERTTSPVAAMCVLPRRETSAFEETFTA
ncbi:hypothetical protein GCM10012320_23230 [Sinomonas cellulolyticus]|nr:hypothetical protein GCM10012320_23230 [Sinomonas sp. KCTC 49339]